MSTRCQGFKYFADKKYDGMMGRCYRPGDRSFKNYGKRGIRVCSAWIKDIGAFRAWVMGELVRLGMTTKEFDNRLQLDRINADGHYTPENCRLVSVQANSRNRRGVNRFFVSAEGEKIAV